MKKLNIILIFLSVMGAWHSYADCPSIKAIQKSKEKFVISDDSSIWSSRVSLQDVKTGTVFSRAVAIGVEIEDEDDKPYPFQSLSQISCEYKINDTSEIKCAASENKSCVFTLEPATTLKPNQCQIKKPKLDPQSPWILNLDATRHLYARVVRYDCQPNPKNSLVSDCPFNFETYNYSTPNVEGGKRVAQSSNSNNT